MSDRMCSLAKLFISAALLIGAASPALAQDIPIAGVHPNERPAGAPVITKLDKPQSWYVAALTGVSQPYPRSLWFLDDQGNWFTPFAHAGMTGPYDIRGWHAGRLPTSN